MKQIANTLTLARILLVGVLVLFALAPLFEEPTTRLLCAVVFFVAALTDFADGAIARGTGTVSDFGKFLDPVADKFMVTASFICMAASAAFDQNLRLLIAACAVIIVLRDLSVTSLRLIAAGKGVVIAAAKAGKIKTFLQCVCILWLFLEPFLLPQGSALLQGHFVSILLLLLCTFSAIYSGITFAFGYRKQIAVN